MAREVYECVLSGTLAGQFVQTVQHRCIDDPTGGPSPFVMAREMGEVMVAAAGLVDTFLNALPEVYFATSLRVRRVSTGGGPTAIILSGEFGGNTQGQRAGAISSAQANPLSIWIPEVEPSKTGRLFWPGVSEDDIDNMQLEPALVAAIDNFNAAWAGTVAVSPFGDTYGCVLRRASHTGDVIEFSYISPLIGTQRRRLRPV